MSPCPCGSDLAACCQQFLDGTDRAPTALALMRSRYTAYVRHHVDYLIATHAPETRHTIDVPALRRWVRTTLWLGLEILSHTDDTVEFIARGVAAGNRPFAQRERSRFRRDADGAWLYVSGTHPH